MEMPRRYVVVSPRTLLTGLVLAVAGLVLVLLVYEASRVLVWMMIALFLALTLDRPVSLLQRRLPRTPAAIVVFLTTLVTVAALAYLVLPPLVDEARSFVNQIPDVVDKLAKGRGPLGSLERKYDIVGRARDLVHQRGASGTFGFTGPLLAILQGVVTTIVGVLAVTFLTLFLLISGPSWWRAFVGYLPEGHRVLGERIGGHVYRAIGGWVIGAIALGLLAGTAATLVLLALGVPNALALGLIVGLLDPIPFVGVTLAGLIVGLVALGTEGVVAGVVFVAFLVAYQNVIENHVLVPVVYGRTVQLDPLGVLVAVLIGGELAGIVGAMAAVPIGGALKSSVSEVLRWRRERQLSLAPAPPD